MAIHYQKNSHAYAYSGTYDYLFLENFHAYDN